MIKAFIRKVIFKFIQIFIPEIGLLKENFDWEQLKSTCVESVVEKNVKLYKPYKISNANIGEYSYVSSNSRIYDAVIGKFCSIGPNFMAGMGLHPTNGLSTAPMFYSKENFSNGISLCNKTKFQEHKQIVIGNDVFIGANVIVLDGVKIGNGAVIGAGAVVTDDIPDYAIAVGVPAKVKKYRFIEKQILGLKKIRWWEWKIDKLQEVEKYFYDVDGFIENNTIV